MKKTFKKFLVFIYLAFSCLSLSSCSVGMLGNFYFRLDGVVRQTLHFNVFNKAILTTFYYEDGEMTSSNELTVEWQHTSKIQRDNQGENILDENGKVVRDEVVNLTYYEDDKKIVIQFFIIGDTLLEYRNNNEFKMHREFTRK